MKREIYCEWMNVDSEKGFTADNIEVIHKENHDGHCRFRNSICAIIISIKINRLVIQRKNVCRASQKEFKTQ